MKKRINYKLNYQKHLKIKKKHIMMSITIRMRLNLGMINLREQRGYLEMLEINCRNIHYLGKVWAILNHLNIIEIQLTMT